MLAGVGYEVSHAETAEATTVQADKLTHAQRQRLSHACDTVIDSAHRGQVGSNVRKGPDEDTLRARNRGFGLGAGASETDWNLNRAHHWYSIHDARVDRTVVNGSGLVADKSDAQMARFRTADGSHIVTEDRWLNTFKSLKDGKYVRQGRLLIMEIKPQPAAADMIKADIQNFDDAIVEKGLQDNVQVSSLSRHVLSLMHDVDPDIPLQLITPVGKRFKIPSVPGYITQINVDYKHAMAPYGHYAHYIGAARAAGFSVSERLAETTDQYRRFMLAGGHQLMLNHVAPFEKYCRQF
jgi:glycerophosphoryl diester phosphodiesterase